MIKESTKQVMRSAATCHPLTSTQPLTVLLFSMMPHYMKYPLNQLGSTILAVSPPILLFPATFLSGRVAWEAEKPLT